MVQHVNQSVASDAPSVSKDNIVDWIVSANTMLNQQCGKVFQGVWPKQCSGWN